MVDWVAVVVAVEAVRIVAVGRLGRNNFAVAGAAEFAHNMIAAAVVEHYNTVVAVASYHHLRLSMVVVGEEPFPVEVDDILIVYSLVHP